MKLNPQQQEAVEQTEGSLLILAGPGSGKTRTITNRYEHLIQKGVSPHEILMVTFTRKAANEMKNRLRANLPQLDLRNAWVETFHRICMDILKKEGQFLGLPTDFRICNNFESKRILQNIIDFHDLSGGNDEEEASVTKENTLEYISKLKTHLVSPSSYKNHSPTLHCMNWEKSGSFIDKIKEENADLYEALKVIYPAYQKELLGRRMMDFEDIMFYTVGLFDKKREVLNKYLNQFKYIMVDEFQDTNHIQFKLVELLAGTNHNVCVVGDDYQSIYRFRGSEIENILDFEQFFKETKIIKLEQNYRSTKHIVELSNEIIRHNTNQKEKTVFTENELGEKVTVIECPTNELEAEAIAKEILTLHHDKNVPYEHMAVLFRNNSHATKFAKVFDEHKIPFQITGDTEFVDRVEVRDVLAYLKLLDNPSDVFGLRRIINKPKRGLGPKSAEYIFENVQENIYHFFKDIKKNESIPKVGLKGIDELIHFYDSCYPTFKNKGIGATIEQLLSVIDYENRVYEKSLSWIQEEVSEGLNELIRLAYKAEKEKGKMSVEQFQEYLSETYIDSENSPSKVTLMTAHKSKGLEYSAVFVTGLDNATFPNEQKDEFEQELEEERRLFYVAVTRAEKFLFLTFPKSREKRIDGSMQEICTEKSIFLSEIWDSEHIHKRTYK